MLRRRDPALDYATVLSPPPLTCLLDVDAATDLPDDPVLRELRVYARVTLLEWIIDPLADLVAAVAATDHAAEVYAEKERIYRAATELYRERFG